jgi:hypothetical protein
MWETLAILLVASLIFLGTAYLMGKILIRVTTELTTALSTSLETVVSPKEVAQPEATEQTRMYEPPWLLEGAAEENPLLP